MKTLGAALITVALILGLAGCAPAPTQYNLTVSATEGGEISTPEEETSEYEEGTVVPLLAFPHSGYRFVEWTGDVSAIDDINAASTTVTMNGDYSITANFVKQYGLTISSTTGGSVTVPGEATYAYAEGEVVDLVAQAEGGWHFVNWSGDVSTIADVNAAITSITMSGSYVITANFAVDLYFEVDAWASLSGEGTVPPEERSSWVTFQIFTNIVVGSVRAELPDGGSVIVPRYTDLSSPDVDQTTLFRFHIYITGMPVAGGEYVFTGVDMAGEPIPGARNTDVWVGVEPPDPPTNVRAEVTEDGIVVSWDESPIVPGSFEPAAEPQLGSYKLSVHRIGPGEMVSIVYTAPFLSACPGLIPRDKADFVEGRDWGLSLGEMGDGRYVIDCEVHGVAPEGSLGRGNEYLCSDPSQTIIFTIQDGEIAIQ